MRRRLPWLIALPVMAAGSSGAHSLSYLLVSARATEAAGEASERASSGGPSYLVLFLGIVAATAIVAACARLLFARAGGSSRGQRFSLAVLRLSAPCVCVAGAGRASAERGGI